MLTEHQLFHLNAIIIETNQTLSLTTKERENLAKCKGVLKGKEESYYLKVIDDVNGLIKKGEFPIGLESSDIHDYIEKDTQGEFR